MTNAAVIYNNTGAVVSKALLVKLVLALNPCMSRKPLPQPGVLS